jgi:hypothetical protein
VLTRTLGAFGDVPVDKLQAPRPSRSAAMLSRLVATPSAATLDGLAPGHSPRTEFFQAAACPAASPRRLAFPARAVGLPDEIPNWRSTQ